MIHITRKVQLPDDFSLKRIRQIAAETLKAMGKPGDASIVFTDDQEIWGLNKEYRGIDAPTDVLSFPSDEIDPETDFRYLGDVIISVEKASSQADQALHPLVDELTMLIVHGCLHLCGLDHGTPEEKCYMKEKQESILKALHIKDFTWPEDH